MTALAVTDAASIARRRSTAARVPPRRVIRSVLAVVGCASLATAIACAAASRVLCNVTPSMPRGLYWVHRGAPPHAHDLVAFAVPPSVRDLVRDRGYLRVPGARLLKPVAGVAGDRVCARDGDVAINGRTAASQRAADSEGRPLPRDARCAPLAAGELYVLAPDPRSFDSRVFGPIDVSSVEGTVTPLWTF